jgi:Integrase core domain
MSPPFGGSLTGVDVQRRYLWKSFRGKPNTIPGWVEKCSASARNPVRLHANPVRDQPGTLFGFTPECCSPSPGIRTFMKTLKYEEVYRQEYRDLADARASIQRFIEKTYNTKRLHSALGYLPPIEFERSLLNSASSPPLEQTA